MHTVVFSLDDMENTQAIALAESDFSFTTDSAGAPQRFSVLGFNVRFKQQLVFNGFADERIVLALCLFGVFHKRGRVD
jgi:hypothetical protein